MPLLVDYCEAHYYLDGANALFDSTGDHPPTSYANQGGILFAPGIIGTALGNDPATPQTGPIFANNTGYSAENGDFIVAAWVKITTDGGTTATQYVWCKGNGSQGNTEWALLTFNHRFTFNVKQTGSLTTNVVANTLGDYTTGVWYHVAASYSATLSKIGIWINGVLDTEATYSSGVQVLTSGSALQQPRLITTGQTNPNLRGYANELCYFKGISGWSDAKIIPQLYNAGVGNTYPFNRAPVVDDIGDYSFLLGDSLAVTVFATDPDYGDAVTFSLAGSPPSGSTISSGGLFQWTPTAAGTYTLTVRATDAGSPALYDEETFTITVIPPVTGLPVVEAGVIEIPGLEAGVIEIPGAEIGCIEAPGFEAGLIEA